MKNFILIVLGIVALSLASCHSTKGSAEPNENFSRQDDISNPDQAITLVDHLRRVAGVQVDGDGVNARIKIRGTASLNSGTEPLFVVNGQPLNGGFQSAIQLISVQQIKSIKVLKNPGEIGFYGVRGANGVIEISLK